MYANISSIVLAVSSLFWGFFFGDATRGGGNVGDQTVISIHAPRTGRDKNTPQQ